MCDTSVEDFLLGFYLLFEFYTYTVLRESYVCILVPHNRPWTHIGHIEPGSWKGPVLFVSMLCSLSTWSILKVKIFALCTV